MALRYALLCKAKTAPGTGRRDRHHLAVQLQFMPGPRNQAPY